MQPFGASSRVNLCALLSSAYSFQEVFFLTKNSFLNTFRVSNSLNADQPQRFVKPGPVFMLNSAEHKILTAHKN